MNLQSMHSGLIILSGGMDSGVLLADAKPKYRSLSALSFHYGSKHNDRELEHAASLAKRFDVPHRTLRLDFFNTELTSSLLSSGSAIPEGTYGEQNMRSTVVPFRNGVMLSIAVALAENERIDHVLLGSHAGDRAVYPDCRAEFTQAFCRAAELGTYHGVQVLAPFAELSKKQIAERGKELDFDFRMTWTCYNGDLRHCGACAACHERRSALTLVLGEDPTEYDS